MNIYIPNIDFNNLNKKSLFIVTRPFLDKNSWSNIPSEKMKWGVSNEYNYVSTIETAAVCFIPLPIQSYSKTELKEINVCCEKNQIKAYGYIAGDFGPDLGFYKHIIFFRMGGFKSQLNPNNQGFPVMLSDHFKRIYQKDEIEVRKKQAKPVVGFCGHASFNKEKQVKEIVKCVIENTKRFFKNPLRKDYEPLFASAFQRAGLLRYFEKSDTIETNFIYRENYRGGAKTDKEREQTTLEYYNNIKNSDYVLCVRGAGNFSVRLYETLLMGRIPIFVNTDCLLPFEDTINWKNHVVWVEWKNRSKIADIVTDFHQNISNESFKNLQEKNRELWLHNFRTSKIFKFLKIKQ